MVIDIFLEQGFMCGSVPVVDGLGALWPYGRITAGWGKESWDIDVMEGMVLGTDKSGSLV